MINIWLSYNGVVSDEYSYSIMWNGNEGEEYVLVELDQGSGYEIEKKYLSDSIYNFTVADALTISVRVTPYLMDSADIDSSATFDSSSVWPSGWDSSGAWNGLLPEESKTATHTVPPTITGLALDGASVEDPFTVTWDAETDIDFYRCAMVSDEGVTVYKQVTTAYATWTFAEMSVMGGSWDSWTAHVCAVISGERGKEDTLVLSAGVVLPVSVMNTDFDAGTMLLATEANTPVAVTAAEVRAFLLESAPIKELLSDGDLFAILDTMEGSDSSEGEAVKVVSFSDLKAALKTYLDTLYAPL